MLPVLLLLLFVSWCAPATAQPSPERLAQLKTQIHRLQTSLADSREQRSKAQRALHQAERDISTISSRQDKLRQQLKANKAHSQRLQRKQQRQIARKSQQVTALVELLRQRSQDGRQDRLKMLLNQQDPQNVARLLQYQHYIAAARSTRIKALNSNLKALAATSKQLLAANQQLQHTQQQLNTQHQRLKVAYKKRQQLLASLNQEVSGKQQHLKRLKANRKQLEELLDGMRGAISDIPANLGKRPFASLAGQLPWPLPGKLEAHYHSRRSGSVRWDGVILAARSGQPVRAVYPGRVVFANWLAGYGQMLIIDQGHGYMTLYGFNQNLTRQVGDWVSAGDIIAHAGASGGRRRPGLYFGIRHHGQPVNPGHWCRRDVRFSQ